MSRRFADFFFRIVFPSSFGIIVLELELEAKQNFFDGFACEYGRYNWS